MSASLFRSELARIPHPIGVVTVGYGGTENGITVSWMTQVSFDPPLLAFAIDKHHYSTELVEDMPYFVLHLLSADQGEVAAHFAKQSTNLTRKIDRFPTRTNEDGLAILTEALVSYECDVVDRFAVGDHYLVVGRVKDATVAREGEPLVTSQGMRYTK